MLACLIFTSSAQAQPGGWRAVENLKPRSRISVKVHLRTICFFVRATHDELVCELPADHRIPFGPSQLTFDRQSIREVRLEHGEAADAALGAAIGGGVGAAVGASVKGSGSLTRGGGAILLGAIGGLVGGFFGRDFPPLHGKVVYKR